MQPESRRAVEGGLLDMPVKEECPLLGKFNGVWADNGDAISLHYTDIPSTHTEYSIIYKALLARVNGLFLERWVTKCGLFDDFTLSLLMRPSTLRYRSG